MGQDSATEVTVVRVSQPN